MIVCNKNWKPANTSSCSLRCRMGDIEPLNLQWSLSNGTCWLKSYIWFLIVSNVQVNWMEFLALTSIIRRMSVILTIIHMYLTYWWKSATSWPQEEIWKKLRRWWRTFIRLNRASNHKLQVLKANECDFFSYYTERKSYVVWKSYFAKTSHQSFFSNCLLF